MTPEEILKQPARVLAQTQREHYFDHGYVGVQDLVPSDILAELQRVNSVIIVGTTINYRIMHNK